MQKLGLRKRAGLLFTIDMGDGFLGVVGLNHATRYRQPGEVAVNPIVGVRHQEVELLVARLMDIEPHEYSPASVVKPLGYLMPEKRFKNWEFNPANAEAMAADLAAAVQEWGFAFMAEASSLDSMIRFAEKKFGYDHQLCYTLPVARALNGDVVGAEADIAGTLEEFGSDDYPAAQEFRKFAERFASWLKSTRVP